MARGPVGTLLFPSDSWVTFSGDERNGTSDAAGRCHGGRRDARGLLVSGAAQRAGPRPEARDGHAARSAAGAGPGRSGPRLRPARHLPAPRYAAFFWEFQRLGHRMLLPRLAV